MKDFAREVLVYLMLAVGTAILTPLYLYTGSSIGVGTAVMSVCMFQRTFSILIREAFRKEQSAAAQTYSC